MAGSKPRRRAPLHHGRAESVSEWEELAGEELMADMALAQQAVEEYETKGIEDTIPYSRYRSKWLGLAS